MNRNILTAIKLIALIALVSTVLFSYVFLAHAAGPIVRTQVVGYGFQNEYEEMTTTYTFGLDGNLNVENNLGYQFYFPQPRFQPDLPILVDVTENSSHVIQHFYLNGVDKHGQAQTLDLRVYFDFTVFEVGAKISLVGITTDVDSEIEYEFENPRSANFASNITSYRIGNILFDWSDLEGATTFEFTSNKLKVKFAAVFNLDPSIVTEVARYATKYSFQRKTFGAQGRYWVFYPALSHNALQWRTSTDGGTWSDAATAVSGLVGFEGPMFGLDVHNDTVDLAYYTSNPSEYIKYKRGTLNADGSITWGTVYTVYDAFTNELVDVVNIFVDVNGYPYVFYANESASPNHNIFVTKSDTNDSSWSTASGFPVTLGAWSFSCAYAGVDLTNGGVYVFFNNDGSLHAKYYDGSNWNVTEDIAALDTAQSFSVVAIENTVYASFRYESPYGIDLTMKTVGDTSWSTVTIRDDTHGYMPTLSKHENTIYVFYLVDPLTSVEWKIYDISTKTVGTASNIEDVKVVSETLTSFYESENNELGFVYTTWFTPYYVKFHKIACPPPPPPEEEPPPPTFSGEYGESEKEEKPPANETAAEPSPLPNLGLWGLVGAVGLIAVGGVLTASSSSSSHSSYRKSSAPKRRYSSPPRQQKTRYSKVK
jgi:hypothetical protein